MRPGIDYIKSLKTGVCLPDQPKGPQETWQGDFVDRTLIGDT